jgi:hypothetical protein
MSRPPEAVDKLTLSGSNWGTGRIRPLAISKQASKVGCRVFPGTSQTERLRCHPHWGRFFNHSQIQKAFAVSHAEDTDLHWHRHR